jgi:CHAT domain-containing protein/Tfp pilus assembly protein PilF
VSSALEAPLPAAVSLEGVAGNAPQSPPELPPPARRHSLFILGFLFLLLLIPLEDTRPVSAAAEYDHARQLLLHGYLESCQQEAHAGYSQFVVKNPGWAARFRILEAEAMVWRGMYQNALDILGPQLAFLEVPDDKINALALEGVAYGHLLEFPQSGRALGEAQQLCTAAGYAACGGVLRARGVLAVEQGRLDDARQLFVSSLDFARAHHDRPLEITALSNLGVAALQAEFYDEAVDWLTSAYRVAQSIGEQNQAQAALGNLGWAYLQLGDTDRALDLFADAEQRAQKLGNVREQLQWLNTQGYTYQDIGNLDQAGASYDQALALARRINSKEDIINSLEVLAHRAIELGRLDEATGYVNQLAPLVKETGTRLDDLDVELAQGMIAAARHQDQPAEAIFRAVESDPDSQTSMRLGADHELAKLYQQRGDPVSADRMYRTALTSFESARQQLKKEDSKLPFLANATPIYDDYIHLLVGEGKAREALDVADHSRARTLEQGLGLIAEERSFHPTALQSGEIARKTGATLLFYWLGRDESYLWAITPTQTALYTLPAQYDIASIVRRYRGALLGPDDPLESSNPDGEALYRMLIEPAAGLIKTGSSPGSGAGSNVVILSDGPLSELNFETLIVPGTHPHYWIEDATVVSAPSLYMLASAHPPAGSGRRVLLIGDAVSPDQDYPELPKAGFEMDQIEKHFDAADQTVFSRGRANPGSYLNSDLEQYAYIHFVAHGVASQTDPLDSAIILSPASAAEDSFKLYARQIIQQPIHARLVTISSCYGGGTRSYAGEGMVGLSWAFLRAGAHNVIGALWEVSDDSTPELMDTLYQRLEQGIQPSAALREAKLELLHGRGNFRNPFYWAPFQIYTGL